MPPVVRFVEMMTQAMVQAEDDDGVVGDGETFGSAEPGDDDGAVGRT